MYAYFSGIGVTLSSWYSLLLNVIYNRVLHAPHTRFVVKEATYLKSFQRASAERSPCQIIQWVQGQPLEVSRPLCCTCVGLLCTSFPNIEIFCFVTIRTLNLYHMARNQPCGILLLRLVVLIGLILWGLWIHNFSIFSRCR